MSRPFVLSNGSASVRYCYDEDGLLRDELFGQVSYPCPVCVCGFTTKDDVSSHVYAWHRAGGPYFGYPFHKRLFPSETPVQQAKKALCGLM